MKNRTTNDKVSLDASTSLSHLAPKTHHRQRVILLRQSPNTLHARWKFIRVVVVSTFSGGDDFETGRVDDGRVEELRPGVLGVEIFEVCGRLKEKQCSARGKREGRESARRTDIWRERRECWIVRREERRECRCSLRSCSRCETKTDWSAKEGIDEGEFGSHICVVIRHLREEETRQRKKAFATRSRRTHWIRPEEERRKRVRSDDRLIEISKMKKLTSTSTRFRGG